MDDETAFTRNPVSLFLMVICALILAPFIWLASKAIDAWENRNV